MKKNLIVLIALLIPCLTQAQEAPNIQVSSSGTVRVLPDFIRIDVVIEKIHKDRAVAKNMADVTTQEVLDASASLGIEENHIVASQLFLSPQYKWNEQTRILVGERAVRTIQIKLYELGNYTVLADQLVNIDITRMDQRGAGFDNIQQHRNQALVEALKNARTKAEVIAGEIGRNLGEVFQVSESFAQPAPIVRKADAQVMAEAMSDTPPAPLEIKAQTISASVAVIYLLE